MRKTKIVFLVCTVMIITAFIPIIGTTKIKNNIGPTVNITFPPDGYETSQSPIVFTGDAGGDYSLNEYGYTIEYPGGGMFSEFWPINPPVEYFEFEISINLVEGADGNLITIYAKDTQNNKGTDSVRVYYTPSSDKEPPDVIITYPQDGQNFADPNIMLQGYISDNIGISFFNAYHYWNEEEYKIYSEFFTDPPVFYEFQFDVTLKPGYNTLKVTAYDESNNKGEDQVLINNEEDPCHKEPILTDETGNTTFYGLFVGCNNPQRVPEDQSRGIEDYEENAQLMRNALLGHEGWEAGNTQLLTGTQATRNNIRNALNNFKTIAQPGDEFVFYFRNHGSAVTDEDGDEPNEFLKRDEILCVSDGDILDDELTEWISNFSRCVTITVILDCCYSRGFNEVQRRARNADGDLYGDDHINVEFSSRSQYTEGSGAASHRRPYIWNDLDNDGIVDAGELIRLRYNSRTEKYYYRDENGQIHEYDEDEVTVLGDLTKGILEGLTESSKFLSSYIYTNADRNLDGKISSKESYEYALDSLYHELVGDNDDDGLLNEDDHEYELYNDVFVSLFIDNDDDEDVDEDPSPPVGGSFFPNEPPNDPISISGSTKGIAGNTYTYSTSTSDSDGDDIFYWFDWGDGKNTEWIGPYNSGEVVDQQHSWENEGDYVIKVKARDRCYAESDWASLEVSMPRNRVMNTPFIRFLQHYPILHQLFQRFLKL